MDKCNCNQSIEAYLQAIPSEWRTQIANVICKFIPDLTCQQVKDCETNTTLNPFTIEDGELCITYIGENGDSQQRCIDISEIFTDCSTVIDCLGSSDDFCTLINDCISVYTSSNGITKTGYNFKLGGTLVDTTTVNLDNKELKFLDTAGDDTGIHIVPSTNTVNTYGILHAWNMDAVINTKDLGKGPQDPLVTATNPANLRLGRSALANNWAGHTNTAIGDYALELGSETTRCTAVGQAALQSNTAGDGNTGVGVGVLATNTTGSFNIAIGVEVADNNTTGSKNIVMGVQALTNNTTGSKNICIGSESMREFNGDNNITIGIDAASTGEATGDRNIFIGNTCADLYTGTVNDKFALANSDESHLIEGDFSTGQIKIGNVTGLPSIVPCAMLELQSTTKGLLLPRMTKTQRDNISTPIAGLAIYQTTNTPGLRVYNGTYWMRYTETSD